MTRNQNRSGQAIIMMTTSIFVMIGMMSLAVDLGWANYRRESAQTAADAAAAAMIRAALNASAGTQVCGASKIWCGTTAGTITACPTTVATTATNTFDNGCMLAAANGFTPKTGMSVTIQANTTTSAPTVPGTTVSYWATVRIAETPSRFFRTSALSTSARATAAITTTTSGAAPSCLYLLGGTGTDLKIGNNAHITTSSCGVYDNSSSSTNATPALTVGGSGQLNSSSIQVVGTRPPAGWTNNGGTISSTPTTGVTAIADPLSALPSPTVPSNCSNGNFTSWVAGGYSLSPGTYCGMSFGNGVNATLASGVYIVKGGTFSVQGGITLTGTSGVMIYLTGGATVNIGNGVTVNMNAQSSGAYQGILFYQDRTMTSPAVSTFAGGSTTKLSGTLYFPHSALAINNGSASATEAIVASSVDFEGGATTLIAQTSQSQTGLSSGTSSVVSFIE